MKLEKRKLIILSIICAVMIIATIIEPNYFLEYWTLYIMWILGALISIIERKLKHKEEVELEINENYCLLKNGVFNPLMLEDVYLVHYLDAQQSTIEIVANSYEDVRKFMDCYFTVIYKVFTMILRYKPCIIYISYKSTDGREKTELTYQKLITNMNIAHKNMENNCIDEIENLKMHKPYPPEYEKNIVHMIKKYLKAKKIHLDYSNDVNWITITVLKGSMKKQNMKFYFFRKGKYYMFSMDDKTKYKNFRKLHIFRNQLKKNGYKYMYYIPNED